MSIEFKNVSYIYSPGSPLEQKGLDQVSFKIKENSFTALIGHTGSGKSTLMQHFNALLKPTEGEITIAGYTINKDTSNKNLKQLRKNVSLVFQFPESQLFENTVLADIAFGPKNFGYSEDEAKELALKWLKKVGLDETVAERSPFELSGGQMRRIAIAGVMAYEPAILCLDEPAAGLDPRGRKEMLELFKEYQESGHTVILVTHNMDDVADYADDVLVMEGGKLIKHATPKEVFADASWLTAHHLGSPTAAKFAQKLAQKGLQLDDEVLTLNELTQALKAKMKAGEA
ncbi:energy-coupling factor transporter ATPase [Lactobacillus corticis]|uniref:Energy-coupling factor transporter ATP-binding protein EcfA2 n=1 Tax=Lactobacillus corticis TaxID=2201249 RepID=A0A916QHS5_9LACO|nr:energy-coupling factor transporter ATPase [Lactobacillus corticis]GFZ27574.1 energy-coupling factor transporter ATP-binding protein [Lactobacillus corticis]